MIPLLSLLGRLFPSPLSPSPAPTTRKDAKEMMKLYWKEHAEVCECTPLPGM